MGLPCAVRDLLWETGLTALGVLALRAGVTCAKKRGLMPAVAAGGTPLQAHAAGGRSLSRGNPSRSVWAPDGGGGHCRVVTAMMAEKGTSSLPGVQRR